MYGADGALTLGPTSPVGVELVGALVRAQRVDSGEQLVGTPPDRLRAALVGRLPPVGFLAETSLRVATELVARQSRTAPDADFVPAPAGYALLDLLLEARVLTGGPPLRLGLEVHNLLNTAWREYTSLLRYYADQPGRDVRLRIGFDL